MMLERVCLLARSIVSALPGGELDAAEEEQDLELRAEAESRYGVEGVLDVRSQGVVDLLHEVPQNSEHGDAAVLNLRLLSDVQLK